VLINFKNLRDFIDNVCPLQKKDSKISLKIISEAEMIRGIG
jgi:hypothetical protein